MASLEDKIKDLDLRKTEARERLVLSYGYMAAATAQPVDKETGAIIRGGAPLVYEPFEPVSPYKIAMKLMRKDAESNPELAQFMEDMDGILNSPDALKKYAELYAKYMIKSPLSRVAKLAKSLGIIVDEEALKPYMGKSMEELGKDIANYEKLDKDGKLTAEQKTEYQILQANVMNLTSKINSTYASRIEKEADKIQAKRVNYLKDRKNKGDIIRYNFDADEAGKHQERANKAYEKMEKKAA